ncbi:MAG: amidohydrolase family protein [Acidimicrobiales bacterium]|nr:amidohydrolase family protein [Acidimicrobiales bacterium]
MNTTPGLVCAHHHLYSTLARGMPAPPHTPTKFLEILEQIWWRLDLALDPEIIRWSAMLGALEALENGTTAVIDHHESPQSIEGSLSIIADACAEVGVRVNCAYGVTDRHGSEGAARGLAENDRYLSEGGKGMVGVHAAFTCSDETLQAAADLALRHQVGVHIHVGEGTDDHDAAQRLAPLATDQWMIIHGVHLEDDHGLAGTVVHNPRSNMNNSVGYARPARFTNPIALGTDGIGADMVEEFRLAFACHRQDDVTATPETSWQWLAAGWDLFPEAIDDRVTWNYDPMDAWHLAYTPGVRPVEVEIGDEIVWQNGESTRVDAAEIRARAAEQANRLHKKLADL